MAWRREYSRDNPTSTNKIRVCLDAAKLVGLEVTDVAITADGLTRYVKAVDVNAALALARVALQITWRIATDRYTEDGDAICFTVELSYDEYEALVRAKNVILGRVEEQIAGYKRVLEEGRARNAAAVRRRIDALTFIKEVVSALVEYHERRRKRARR